MIKVPPLPKEQEEELRRMTRQEKGEVVLRAQLILWAARDQQSVPELAQRMGWTQERVRHWVHRFLEEGPAGLYDRPGRGRPSRRTPAVEQQMEEVLERGEPPAHTGYTRWTVALLVGWLACTWQLSVHASTVRRWVQELGFRWKRPKTEPKGEDPQREWKMARIESLRKKVKGPSVVLFEDETTLRLLPLIRGMWMRVGQQVRILTGSGWNQSLKVFGALNAASGQWTYRIFQACNGKNFIAFLEVWLQVYPRGRIYLVVDYASWHRSREVIEWLGEHPRLELVWLPKGSPKLNPVERIWGKLKDRVAADRWYGTLQALRQAAESFLDSLSPQEALEISRLAA